ncbi:hypothetical protein C8N46_10333 [Kordia periserrulae]|uniref:Uncharacterized protein n=1 Tax=Kordia periserrulae TaxID=701523 RepID=A0A2T6C0U1_9FLAO|nr:hypothetical protein [Kordia periserrulae]PTX61936.1 hypothetical protein C8N46_10333 [Kordia periserrulae]
MEDGIEYTIEDETQEDYDYASIIKLSRQFRLRKLVGWAIRTAIVIILCISFWEYAWVKWALVFYIPLNLFGLYAILKVTNTVDTKIEEVMLKLEEFEALLAEEEEE